jgi:replicative DNA helicase
MESMTATPDKTIPHNVEAEEAVLGSLLIDPEAIFRVSPFLKPDDFYIVKNGWIYDAILSLHEHRQPADFVTVCDELENRTQLEEAGGAAYIASLINVVPTAIHVEAYARIVERTAIRRRLISAAGQIASFAYEEDQPVDEVIDRSESVLFSISQRHAARDLVPVKQVLADYYDRIAYLYEHRGEPLGIPTGFIDLDKLLGGLQRSDLIIIAARPGVGKTSMLLAIALTAARRFKQKVALFSLEMSNEQLVQRLMSSETGIDSQRLRLGDLKETEWPKFAEAAGRLSDAMMFIDDTPGISALQLRTKARRLHAEYGLDLIMVDYLQLMSGDTRGENRVQEISYISRALKGLARELNVPLIAASQLSRAVEQRHDKRPILSDLRESGCLRGDSLVHMADGSRVAIRNLAGSTYPLPIIALNPETFRLEAVQARKAWKTGTQPVFRLKTQWGREIRATANHKFHTMAGWKRLDQLGVGERVAVRGGAEASSFAGPALAGPEWRTSRQAVGVAETRAPQPSIAGIVYWDRIVSVEPEEVRDVYDLEVPGHHNFVANDIIVHNSIEQDADVVMFIYRDELYNPETELQNIADILVAKHRHGPTGTVQLFFRKHLAQFVDAEVYHRNLEF